MAEQTTQINDLGLSQEVVEKKHPKGLWVLFGTEMWERVNFYGMRALLTLFLVNSLRMEEGNTSLIYGGFLGLCYLTPMLGGFVADRFLGNRNCILLGGTLMAIGQFLLFCSATIFGTNLGLANTLMWIALGVIIFGNGFFKPNISSMVGSLYPKTHKSKLDSAFTIFYMGINLGALIGQSVCPYLGDVTRTDAVTHQVIHDNTAFKWGFLFASIAMVIGTIFFYFLKNKYVVTPEGRPIGGLPSKNESSDFAEGESQKANFSNNALLFASVLFPVLGILIFYIFHQNFVYSLIYSSGISLATLIVTDSSLTKIERDRIFVIYIISFFIIFFWAAFEQAGSSLTFIASNQTDRHIFGSVEIPPSMVQIFNGIFVVALAIPFSMLWDYLNSKRKEPTSPFKQAIGLALIALSYFIIANNVKYLGNEFLAVKWLALLYFIQTMGELCLSPIGLSLVGKLAPKRFSSLLYGVFFLSNASGYALAGTLGSILPATSDKFATAKTLGIDLQAILDKTITPTAQQIQLLNTNQIRMDYPVFAGCFTIHNLYEFFMVFVVLCGVASVLLFALTPLLKKMMHGLK
jgi:POT family proton-dependent oligopeptide transporter